VTTRATGGLIGHSIRRQEDPRLLRGQGVYVGDLTLPGLLHLAVLRSPHAHARIQRIDIAVAAKVPGVVSVLGVLDVEGLGELPVLTRPPGQRHTGFPILPADTVLYVGQPVAAVVAENRYVAEDALERMVVEYTPLPAVTDPDQALAADAPRLHGQWPDNVAVSRDIETGDPHRVFASAHTIVEVTFTLPRQTAAPLEGRVACASFDQATGELPCGRPARRRISTGRSWPRCSTSTRAAFG
jgi:aerobic carbon-monoxide dehydrogenase large subunit